MVGAQANADGVGPAVGNQRIVCRQAVEDGCRVLCYFRGSEAEPGRDAAVNLLGSINVFAAAHAVGARRMVNISTGGAIYGATEVVPTPEDAAQRVQRRNRHRGQQEAVPGPVRAGDHDGVPNLELIKVPKHVTDTDARDMSEQHRVPDLSGARLSGSILLGAKLARASLKGTDLTKADLSNAVLRGADLHGAKLQGANLTGADLTGADLTNALYDAATRWPTGFDPQKHGALLVR